MTADIRQAFDKASGPKTPFNPSRRAIARVKNPLPAPTCCRYCNSAVALVNNSEIYSRSYGEWPWAYLCQNRACRAYVGVHPQTAIPLGTLADKELREWRSAAKHPFLTLQKARGWSRTAAYTWLAEKLGIPYEECHFGWFDEDRCFAAGSACDTELEGGAA